MKRLTLGKICLIGGMIAALLLTVVPSAGLQIRAAEAGTPGTGNSGETGAGFPEMDEDDWSEEEWLREAADALAEIVAERDIMALVYLADKYPVRTAPSYDSDTALTVLSGQQVNILEVCLDEEYEVWAYVSLAYGKKTYYGYIPRNYLAVSDSRFLGWEEDYGFQFSSHLFAVDADGQSAYPDIEQFPESYREPLMALKESHPNWTFVKMNTTLDWNDAVRQELKGGKSLVYKTFPDWAKDGLYDTGTWYYATETVLKIYMDPRNGLTEDSIFQFEQLTYNAEYHTLEAVRNFLSNTFMNDGNPAPGGEPVTYAELFWRIGGEAGREVSPFHLAARVLQEQGKGTSPLISGTYPGYEGYYNYFNIGASGTSDREVIENGLKYARDHNWCDAGSAVAGGADHISANYIKKGQDTLYLEKFNVNPNGVYPVYTHQYMQNISAPKSEAASIRKLYAAADSLDSTFVFKIPVYENMPGKACGAPGTEPAETLDITLELPGNYETNQIWLDGVACEGVLADGKVTVAALDKNAETAVIYRYDESGVPTGMYVWSLSYADGAYRPVPQPELEDLLTYHGFSIRITGKSGIRFKTGIAVEKRNRLANEGINGYRLKEYGTLLTNNANRATYPMVKGGTKVQSGMAYGTDGNGEHRDVIYETVDGRYRYTAVLVGLPASQYKTEIAFRGYIVLEKDGKCVTLYGPPMARSIYFLAERYLERGTYAPGSAAYDFLRQLINDADREDQR